VIKQLLRKLFGWPPFTLADKVAAVAQLVRRYPDAVEHDFTRGSWGCSMTRVAGGFATWSTPRVEVGDRVRVGRERFIVFEARPCGDPPDMAFIKFWRLPGGEE
jgi:hypothetical protein